MLETYRGVVYPWLADQMGHLTTSRYVEMFDTAFYHLVHLLGEPPVGEGALGWADVRQTIDYRHEARMGALVLIRSGIVRTGRTSLVARHVMSSADEDVVHAIMEATTVRFDLSERKAVPLTAAFLANATAALIEAI